MSVCTDLIKYHIRDPRIPIEVALINHGQATTVPSTVAITAPPVTRTASAQSSPIGSHIVSALNSASSSNSTQSAPINTARSPNSTKPFPTNTVTSPKALSQNITIKIIASVVVSIIGTALAALGIFLILRYRRKARLAKIKEQKIETESRHLSSLHRKPELDAEQQRHEMEAMEREMDANQQRYEMEADCGPEVAANNMRHEMEAEERHELEAEVERSESVQSHRTEDNRSKRSPVQELQEVGGSRDSNAKSRENKSSTATASCAANEGLRETVLKSIRSGFRLGSPTERQR